MRYAKVIKSHLKSINDKQVVRVFHHSTSSLKKTLGLGLIFKSNKKQFLKTKERIYYFIKKYRPKDYSQAFMRFVSIIIITFMIMIKAFK